MHHPILRVAAARTVLNTCDFECALDIHTGLHRCRCRKCERTTTGLPRFAEMPCGSVEKSHQAGPEPQRSTDDSGTFCGGGPGTELSKLLKRIGIEPTPTCQCRAKAAQMDAWGPDECAKPERIEEVVAVMREEAKARGLPFLDAVGRLLVRRAIKNARRAAAN